jgi:pseudouridine-5'-phosphate glycosidase
MIVNQGINNMYLRGWCQELSKNTRMQATILFLGQPIEEKNNELVTNIIIRTNFRFDNRTAFKITSNYQYFQGAVPATIAILQGRISVGLSHEQLSGLAEGRGKGSDTIKVSRRDMARTVAFRMNGGTTVSGTMVIAARVGIQVFVTGGIGM